MAFSASFSFFFFDWELQSVGALSWFCLQFLVLNQFSKYPDDVQLNQAGSDCATT